ncbi:MAG: hypothetical protein C5B52_15325 [Bacteroidetes bacterium]|nr:MAG: hypothetical protein C5B52_15325 [Bacteroidota bacterium]
MKKLLFRLIFLSISLFTSSIVKSQVLISILFGKKLNTDKLEFGLAVGMNYAGLTNLEAKYRPGINLALYFNWKISENFFFHPEASPKFTFGAKDIQPYSLGDPGLDSLFKTGKVKRSLKYIGVPLLARYRVKGLFFVLAGPSVNLRVNANDEFKTKVNGQELTYENKVKDQYAAFEIGLSGGVEWKFRKDKGLGLSLRYYHGLTSVLSDNAVRQRNSAFQIIMSIPIGVGKNPEHETAK